MQKEVEGRRARNSDADLGEYTRNQVEDPLPLDSCIENRKVNLFALSLASAPGTSRNSKAICMIPRMGLFERGHWAGTQDIADFHRHRAYTVACIPRGRVMSESRHGIIDHR
jgi:hypothetical protein